MTVPRVRLDAELVRRGLASSREQARDLVAAGRVTVAGQQADPQRRGRIERPPPGRALQRAQPGPYRLDVGQPLDQRQGQIAQQRFGL